MRPEEGHPWRSTEPAWAVVQPYVEVSPRQPPRRPDAPAAVDPVHQAIGRQRRLPAGASSCALVETKACSPRCSWRSGARDLRQQHYEPWGCAEAGRVFFCVTQDGTGCGILHDPADPPHTIEDASSRI